MPLREWRGALEWEKISIIHTSDLAPEYLNNSYISTRKRHLGKNGYVSGKRVWQKCSTSLVIREIEWDASVHPLECPNCKRTDDALKYFSGGVYTGTTTLEHWQQLPVLNKNTADGSAIPPLGMTTTELNLQCMIALRQSKCIERHSFLLSREWFWYSRYHLH